MQRKKDKKEALAYFEKALDLDKSNFPCLMDHLRIKLPRIRISEGVKLVSDFLPSYKHKPIFHLKLHIILGSCKYHDNDLEGAIQAWIEVFSEEEDVKKLTEGDKSTLRAELKV